MPSLPSGTVTFLFTDIEGSTRLLHDLGAQRYGEALAEHRRILRDAFGRHGGREVDTQGDAFFVAFPSAPAALAAAREAQAALDIPVRMGIHTGTPLLSAEGYVGADVHKAARIAAAGHGRQVLVSSSTAALVDETLRDLGEHRLKDLSAPERIYQLGNEEFPRLNTLYQTNLPIAATPLIGREKELAEVTALLADGTRLITVTGPGGTGKTRFAVQAASDSSDRYADGVFWVPLQALADSELVLPAIAQAVDSREDLEEFLANRELLLVIDNFEHVLGAASSIGRLLTSCPRLGLLVTSRAALRIEGEHELTLEPLGDGDAMSLFIERARASGGRVEPSETVAAICRRLDNLPLALELAAARTKLLGPAALLDRLERALPLLTGGRRDAPERQRTLRATIEWSYKLLDREAQNLLARLSVFAGSFALEAAEDLCDADLDTLSALVDLSLVKATATGRFRILETVREFALERLEDSDEAKALRERFAQHFLGMVESAAAADKPALVRVPTKVAADRLEADYDNVRAAVYWLFEIGDATRAAAVTDTLFWSFLNVRGRYGEAVPMLEAALSLPALVDSGARADALATLAILRGDTGDDDTAQRLATESVAIARQIGGPYRLQRGLRTLARYQSDPADRQRMLLECEELAIETGDDRSLAWVNMLLGWAALETRDLTEARRRMERWLELMQSIGSFDVVMALSAVGCVAVQDGRIEDARNALSRGLRQAIHDGATNYAVECLDGFAAVALADGDPATATRLLAVAANFREQNKDFVAAHWRTFVADTEAAARVQLGSQFAIDWETGRSLELWAGAELALSRVARDA